MTLAEAKSEIPWPFQSLEMERKPGLQVGNIATMENASCISCFLVATLAILEHNKSRSIPRRA